MPTLGFAPGVSFVLLLGAREIARRMAGAAMPKPFGEIRAAVPLRAFRGIGTVRPLTKKEGIPAGEERARDRHRGWHVLGMHRLARHDERVERAEVVVSEQSE